jgi:hypothetical protein
MHLYSTRIQEKRTSGTAHTVGSNSSIVTEVPGPTDRGTRNGERGTALGMYFYTAGTKMFPRSHPGTAFRSPVTMNSSK